MNKKKKCNHEWRLLEMGHLGWHTTDVPHKFFCIHCLEIKEVKT